MTADHTADAFDLAALRRVAEAAAPPNVEVGVLLDPPTVLTLLDRLEAAEAKVARVEALADQWEAEEAYRCRVSRKCQKCIAYQRAVLGLRRVLRGESS